MTCRRSKPRCSASRKRLPEASIYSSWNDCAALPGWTSSRPGPCWRNSAPTGVYLRGRSRPLAGRGFVRAITKAVASGSAGDTEGDRVAGAAHSRPCLLPAARWDRLPGIGRRLLRPVAAGSYPEPAHPAAPKARRPGHTSASLQPAIRSTAHAHPPPKKRPPLQMRGKANPLHPRYLKIKVFAGPTAKRERFAARRDLLLS